MATHSGDSIVQLIKEINKTSTAFERHPGRTLSAEDKVHYLNGLALVASVDDVIAQEESDYLKELISAFDIPDEKFKEFIAFSKKPNREEIQAIKSAFEDTEIKYVFMVDAIFIAQADRQVNAKENVLLEEFFNMFDISDQERKKLLTIHTKIKTAEDVYHIFKNTDKIKQELFNYLLDYKQKRENIEMFIVLKKREILFFRKQPDNKWDRWWFGGERSYAMKYADVERNIKDFKETLLDKLNLTYFENYSVKVLYSQYNKMDLKVLLDYFFDENCKAFSIMPLDMFQKDSEEFDETLLYTTFPLRENEKPIQEKKPEEKPQKKKYRVKAMVDQKTLNKITANTTGVVSGISASQLTVSIAEDVSVILLASTIKKETQSTFSQLFQVKDEVDVIRNAEGVFIEFAK